VRARATADQSISNSTSTAINFTTEDYDSNGFHDNSTNNTRLTVPTGMAGKYHITGALEMDASATGAREIWILLNGTTVIADLVDQGLSGVEFRSIISTDYDLAAGDYVELMINQASGSSKNVKARANHSPFFSMHQILAAGTSTDGWVSDAATWTRTANTTFTVSGDVTAQFSKGTRIQVTDTTTKYFVVTNATFSSGTTTVTISGGSDYSLAATPTARWYSYQANPQGYPGWFNYTPSWTAAGTAPALGNGTLVGRFHVVDRHVVGNVQLTMGSTTTFGTSTYFMSLPINSTSAFIGFGGNPVLGFDNSASTQYLIQNYIEDGTKVTLFYHDAANNGRIILVTNTAPVTWATSDIIRVQFSYEMV